jgi:hypothetical protein
MRKALLAAVVLLCALLFVAPTAAPPTVTDTRDFATPTAPPEPRPNEARAVPCALPTILTTSQA